MSQASPDVAPTASSASNAPITTPVTSTSSVPDPQSAAKKEKEGEGDEAKIDLIGGTPNAVSTKAESTVVVESIEIASSSEVWHGMV